MTTLLRDPTAEKRRRSLHTRASRGSKGGSPTTVLKTKVLETKKGIDMTSSKVQKKVRSIPLVTLVKEELELYKDKHDIYNGLINIIKKPEFLVACYEEIKGKPGNMTEGIKKGETIDGLN